jgi:integrase
MLALRWSEVDLATRTARLQDTKTGGSLRPLSHGACDVLRSLPRLGALVFPASSGSDKAMSGYHKIWMRIAAKAGFPTDVTPHILRHSFASIAADLGYSETDDRIAFRTPQGECYESLRAPCRRYFACGCGCCCGAHKRNNGLE